jgi:hypothetical protein
LALALREDDPSQKQNFVTAARSWVATADSIDRFCSRWTWLSRGRPQAEAQLGSRGAVQKSASFLRQVGDTDF